MFSYEKGNGKIQEFNLKIGEQWSKQDIKNQELNTIFSLIDDGDGTVSEQEYNLFDRLLKIADSFGGEKGNKISEKSELQELIEKVKKQEIKISDLKNTPEETFDEEKYSVENLKKRFPEDKYEFKFPMSCQLRIIDKSTGKIAMEIFYTKENEINGVYAITEYDKDRNELFRVYGSDKKLVSYIGKDGVRHEVLPEKIYAEITQKKLGFITTTGKNLGKYLNELNKNNIEEILIKYKSVSENSLISDIFSERGLDAELRAEYVKQIIDTWLDARETKYIKKIDNFREAFYKLIESEKNSLTPMSAKKIEMLMKQIEERQQLDVKIFRTEEKEAARKANGTIDNDFYQGATGDCWFLASIKSIINNPVAKAILESQISVDKDENVTVNLRFVGKKYTFSKEEVEKRTNLSEGDLDVRALEMAVEKYFEEESFSYKFNRLFSNKEALDGNWMNRAYEILLGRDGGLLNRTYLNSKFVNKDFIESIKEGKYIATVTGSYHTDDLESDVIVKDKNNTEHSLIYNHAYAIISADDEYVYLVNPWDTSSTLEVPMDVFIDFFDFAGTYDVEDANKNYFGENAVTKDDGRVFIPSTAKGTLAKTAEGYGKRYVSDEELAAIRKEAEQKYGNDYSISVNKNGDILLTPKENNKA